jgi:uncharacterized protein (DUF4415 family)
MVASDSHRSGDKVGLKAGAGRSAGARGFIESIEGNGRLVVRVTDSNKVLRVHHSGVTNFSLAARKAWRNMPDRRVGRPKGSTVCDRVSVTIRLDRDLWESFRSAEAAGFVTDRTATLNTWLRECLKRMPLPVRKLVS